MSSEFGTEDDVDIHSVSGNFSGLPGVATCDVKQVTGPKGTYARFSLYLQEDVNPLEVLTLAKLGMPGMWRSGETAWVENDGSGRVIVIGAGGLNPAPSRYPNLNSF